MDFIGRMNKYIADRSAETGKSELDALMELADMAGFDTFNPHNASDWQLQEMASMIPGPYKK